MHGQAPRPIRSELKSHRIKLEEERPDRWPYMKILRETSSLKEFYPEIDPYVEVYRMRSNMWAIFQESMDGAGDVWMYLIDGPEKAMLIDDGFGVGDLRSLVQHLVGDKELIVVNTHAHVDHCFGNSQFDRVWCEEHEVDNLKRQRNPHIWDYLFGKDGKPQFTEFDPNDIVPFHEYEIVGVPDGYRFDLGNGYLVELVHLPGHAPGMSAYYDLHNQDIFVGDTNGMSRPFPNDCWPEFYTVEALRNGLRKLQPRFYDIKGVFPGHGMLDQPNVALQNILDATEAVCADPTRFDSVKVVNHWGTMRTIYSKNILNGSTIRYEADEVYMDPDRPTGLEAHQE